MELFLHKGVSTHSAGKYTTSLRDMTKMLHLCVAIPRWGNNPIFGSAPKAEPFSSIPNHKLIRHCSLTCILEQHALVEQVAVGKRQACRAHRLGMDADLALDDLRRAQALQIET